MWFPRFSYAVALFLLLASSTNAFSNVFSDEGHIVDSTIHYRRFGAPRPNPRPTPDVGETDGPKPTRMPEPCRGRRCRHSKPDASPEPDVDEDQPMPTRDPGSRGRRVRGRGRRGRGRRNTSKGNERLSIEKIDRWTTLGKESRGFDSRFQVNAGIPFSSFFPHLHLECIRTCTFSMCLNDDHLNVKRISLLNLSWFFE